MINTESNRVEFEDGAWMPIVGWVVLTEDGPVTFDTQDDANEFAKIEGLAVFPVVSTKG